MDIGYEDEEWENIPGFPNYMISSYGRVFNVQRHHFLRPCIDTYGYAQVTLYRKDHSRHRLLVHHLVANAFLPIRQELHQINHDDGDKTYNYVENIDWVTPGENIRHAVKTGLKPPSNNQRIRIVETGEVFESITSCARAINGFQGAISLCLLGKRNHHKGFTFEYV